MNLLNLELLRDEIEKINFELLRLLNQRAQLVTEVQGVKTEKGIPTFIPEREQKMLAALVARNQGPFSDQTVRNLFQEIFRASVKLMESSKELRVSRAHHSEDLHIVLGDAVIGDAPILIAGPCSVESEEQMEEVASFLASRGVRFIRGGAFKPRSNPYSFQGLGVEGLKLLQQAGRRHGLLTVTEVMDTRSVEVVAEHADILQIGSRNMYNYDLLREVGRQPRPVLLKRGLAASIDEFILSAEYIVSNGNENVILCERGIRTFELETRNTLDISAVPVLQQKTYLPVIIDVSHAAGRRDILGPLGRAALAVGADGVMVEVHPCPAQARSDAEQQLSLEQFERFLQETGFDRILAAAPLRVAPVITHHERIVGHEVLSRV